MRPTTVGMCSSIHFGMSSTMMKRKFGLLAWPPTHELSRYGAARVAALAPKKRRRVRVLGSLSASLFIYLWANSEVVVLPTSTAPLSFGNLYAHPSRRGPLDKR